MALPTRGKRQQPESKPRPPDSHEHMWSWLSYSLFAYSIWRNYFFRRTPHTDVCLEKVLSSACVWGTGSGVWADTGWAVLAAHRFSSPPPPLLSPPGEAGAQQRFPRCPAGLAVTHKGQMSHCRRQLEGSGWGTWGSAGGGDGCPFLLPSVRTEKAKEPPSDPAQWDSRGQVHSSSDARFPSAEGQNALPWLLPLAVPVSCLCRDAGSSPMSPCHTTPRGSTFFTYSACGSISSGWGQALST